MKTLRRMTTKNLDNYLNNIYIDLSLGEYQICIHFACSKKLTMIESLAGTKCTKHTYEKKVNPMQVFKFK